MLIAQLIPTDDTDATPTAMNLRNILLAERDKTQSYIHNLQHVVTNIDKLIACWDEMEPPGSERLANVTGGPDLTVQIRPEPSSQTKTPSVSANGDLTHAQLCARWGCNSKRVVNLKYLGKLRGGPGLVTLASVESYEQRMRDGAPVKHMNPIPPNEMPVAEAADQVGVSATRIGQMVNEGKLVRIRYGVLDRPSVEAWLQKRNEKTEPITKHATSSPAKPTAKSAKPAKGPATEDAPSPIEQEQPDSGAWNPQHAVNDRYESMEKAAKELQCNMDWLRTVKKSGRIAGAPDWINMNQLEAYLKHPDFDEPLIHRAP